MLYFDTVVTAKGEKVSAECLTFVFSFEGDINGRPVCEENEEIAH